MEIKPAVSHIFDQLQFLLENLTNDEYAHSLKILSGASVGQHMRHTLDFFSCLKTGMAEGLVNYDQRERDIFLENNTLEALTTLNGIRQWLDPLTENQPLHLVRHAFDQSSDQKIEVGTNLLRELIYNIEHAVHHMALIKIGLKEIKPDLQLPQDFGVASSTVRYRQSQQASL